jgi:isoquinoline 1-oxidoreductase beta subunit
MSGPAPARVRLLTRRELVLAGAVGALAGVAGLWLGFAYGVRKERWRKNVPERGGALAPSSFVAVEADGSVRVFVTKTEMGQGVFTALPMLVAEELDADWARVQPVIPLASRNYGDQATANSSSVRSLWHDLRSAGAAAREMLRAAGGAALGVPVEECHTEAGFVVHAASGRRVGYGALVESARRQPVPAAPRLKQPQEFRLLGRSLPRKDLPAKLDGSARFGLDVRLPGQLFAVVARPPALGGRVLGGDTAAAMAVPGVRHVVAIPQGIAVVATDTWAACRGRAALDAKFADGPHGAVTDATIQQALAAACDGDLAAAEQQGAGAPALAGPGRVLEARYALPFLAHAPMEPINVTAWCRPDRCEIHAPTQSPQELLRTAAQVLGRPEPEVHVHTTFAGGGFGRRVFDAELREVLAIAQQVPAPVQLLWTRDDDLRHDFFRPAAHHRLQCRIDPDGVPVAWRHRIASPSIVAPDAVDPAFVDPVAVEGAVQGPYALPHRSVEYRHVATPVPVGFWRSVGHSHTAFAVECFVDELAELLQRDPAELRLALYAAAPRHRGVLQAVQALASAVPLPADHARGLAVHASFGSYVAMVAEVTARGAGPASAPVVTRVFCAADVGLVVHPDTVQAQLEGGILFGLTAALYGHVRIDRGRVATDSFATCQLLRYSEAPALAVRILDSGEAPGGAGEIGVPPIAPAVANAWSRLRGRRVRELPLR